MQPSKRLRLSTEGFSIINSVPREKGIRDIPKSVLELLICCLNLPDRSRILRTCREWNMLVKSQASNELNQVRNIIKNINCPYITPELVINFKVSDPILPFESRLKRLKERLADIFRHNINLLSKDFNFLMYMVSHEGSLLEYAAPSLKTNAELIVRAVTCTFFKPNDEKLDLALKHVPKNMKTYDLVKKAVSVIGMALKYAPLEFRNMKEIVLIAVKKDGLAIQFATKKLRKDRDVVLAAVSQNGEAYFQTEPEFRNDLEIGLAAVKAHGRFKHFPPEFQANFEIAMEAVKIDPHNIKHVNTQVENYNNIALEAIRRDGTALSFVPDKLRSNLTFVTTAILQNGLAIEHARINFEANGPLLLAAGKQNGLALQFIPFELRTQEIVEAAIGQNPKAYSFLHIFKNPLIGKTMTLKTPSHFHFDKKLASMAVRKNGLFLQFLISDFSKDQELVNDALNQDGRALQYVHDSLKDHYPTVLTAVRKNWQAFAFASEKLKFNEDLIKHAISQDREAFQLVPLEIRDSIDEVQKYMKVIPAILHFATKRVQKAIQASKRQADLGNKIETV